MTCARQCAALSSALLRQDILPLTIGYALLMLALATGLLMLRRTARTTAPGTGSDLDKEQSAAEGAQHNPGAVRPGRYAWFRLMRQVGVTFVGGYLLLMVVVVGYYYGVARVSGNFIESAFTGCAMLIGLSLPVFLAATWLLERRRARPRPVKPAADSRRG
jgi:hypothetical protein